ncbi:MAG TPA: isochorismate synthase [Acidimicrobiia bacterium]|nr:isochorismate synthase [Acidimicrobiia bacterium]
MTTAPVAVRRLRAVTRPADPPVDLLDELGSDGFAWLHGDSGFVTSGVATRVHPDDAVEVLAEIDHDDEVGTTGSGPVAAGALPFAAATRATLTVPSRIVGRHPGGRGWVTEIGTGPRVPTPLGRPPERFEVAAKTTPAAWAAAVDAALESIHRGDLEKVVLARAVEIVADRPFLRREVLARLRTQQPGCCVYADDGFLGATPELLIRRTGTMIASRPMAGSASADDPVGLDRLAASAKDAREHRLVVDAIVAALTPWCRALEADDEPVVASFATIAHLATEVVGTLREPAPDALALALALHPTPAVGGVPRPVALDAIHRLEGSPRGCYAGPIGWVDTRGDGEWGVALRGASLEGTTATLHAGAGIVDGSVASAEWRETEAKLAPMLRALTGT